MGWGVFPRYYFRCIFHEFSWWSIFGWLSGVIYRLHREVINIKKLSRPILRPSPYYLTELLWCSILGGASISILTPTFHT